MENTQDAPQITPSNEGSSFFQQEKSASLNATRFFACGIVMFSVLYGVGIFLPSMQLWAVILSSLVIAVPIGMFFAYCIAIKETHSSLTFREGGLVSWLLKRRTFLIIITCVMSPILAVSVMMHIAFMKTIDWILLGIGYIAFYVIYRMIQKILAKESVTWMLYKRSATATVWFTVGVLFIVQIVFIYMQLYDYPIYNGLKAAISSSPILIAKCNIVSFLYKWASFFGATKAYLIGLVMKHNFEFHYQFIFLAILTLSSYIVFASLFAFLSVPFKEYKRISLQKNVPSIKLLSLSGVEIFLTTLISILLIAIYTSSCIAINEWISTPDFKRVEKEIEQIADKVVIMVDGEPYDVKIRQALENLDKNFSARRQDAIKRIVDADAMACEVMRKNVETFLDWYYSIPAEYARIGHFLIGNAENYIQEKLTESLQKNLNFAGREEALKAFRTIEEQWVVERKALSEKFKLPSEQPKGTKPIVMTKDFLTKLPDNQSDFSFNVRMGMSGTAASVAGVIAAGAIVKPASKVALSALVKFVASKAAGTGISIAGGAVAGGLAGSFIPVLGTAIGAAIGGTVTAIGVWIATDAAVLTLDEMLTRDDFRKDILSTIDDTYCRR